MQRLPVRLISQFLFFQAVNKDPAERKEIVRSHLSGVEQLTQNLNATHIFNMDETPVYTDMVSNCTLDFKGNKNVDGVTTGHEKCRFTFALTISAAGNFLKTYRGVVSTGPLARGHLIWPPGHLLLDSTGPDWPPTFKA